MDKSWISLHGYVAKFPDVFVCMCMYVTYKLNYVLYVCVCMFMYCMYVYV